MKFALLLAALSPSLASASPAFWCGSETSDVSVSFSESTTQADVQMGRDDALKVVAELECGNADAKSRADQAYLVCKGQNGYEVALNNASGPILATVSRNGRAVAKLTCGR